MIFVTVGAQMPFDRLVSAVDEWAGRTPGADVFAQIGGSALRPAHMRWTRFLDPEEFRRNVEASAAVVAHAGMGTILTALGYGRPLVVMPRRGDLRETRNDHQSATAERFRSLRGVLVAQDVPDLWERLGHIQDLPASERVAPCASPELLRTLREFVAETSVLRRLEAART